MEDRQENQADKERYEQATDLIMQAFAFDHRRDEKPGEFLQRHMPSRAKEFKAKHFTQPKLRDRR